MALATQLNVIAHSKAPWSKYTGFGGNGLVIFSTISWPTNEGIQMTNPNNESPRPRSNMLKYLAIYSLGAATAYLPFLLNDSPSSDLQKQATAEKIAQIETTVEHIRSTNQELMYHVLKLSKAQEASELIALPTQAQDTKYSGSRLDRAIEQVLASAVDEIQKSGPVEPEEDIIEEDRTEVQD